MRRPRFPTPQVNTGSPGDCRRRRTLLAQASPCRRRPTGTGSSSFAFALPVRPGWEVSLGTITLSRPGGGITLDGGSDIPMAILRNPWTGQVRGILRDPPSAAEVAADAVGGAAPGLEVLFSRGIPGAAGWRR